MGPGNAKSCAGCGKECRRCEMAHFENLERHSRGATRHLTSATSRRKFEALLTIDDRDRVEVNVSANVGDSRALCLCPCLCLCRAIVTVTANDARASGTDRATENACADARWLHRHESATTTKRKMPTTNQMMLKTKQSPSLWRGPRALCCDHDCGCLSVAILAISSASVTANDATLLCLANRHAFSPICPICLLCALPICQCHRCCCRCSASQRSARPSSRCRPARCSSRHSMTIRVSICPSPCCRSSPCLSLGACLSNAATKRDFSESLANRRTYLAIRVVGITVAAAFLAVASFLRFLLLRLFVLLFVFLLVLFALNRRL